MRRDETFALGQVVFRVFRADAREEVVVVGVVLLDPEFIVPAPAERCADHASRVFAWPSVQADHHLAVGGVGVARAVDVLDDLDAAGERLGADASLVGPGAVQAGDPGVAAADGQVAGVEAGEYDRFLAVVVDPGPGLDHVFVPEGLVVQPDGDRIEAVFQGDGQELPVLPVRKDPVPDGQVQRLVAVGLREGERRLGRAAQSVGRVGGLPAVAGVLQFGGVVDPGAVIDDPGVPALLQVEGQGGMPGLQRENAQERKEKVHHNSIVS